MRTKATIDELPIRADGTGAAHLATIVAVQPDGGVALHLDEDGPAVVAKLAVPATRERLDRAIATRQPAVVVFEGGDTARPIIVGFLELDEPQPVQTTASPAIEADVDGRRVKVVAQDEIVLECGSASITLRRNGRVIIRGTYVETRSDGTNRIKGGQVQIN